MPYYIFFLFCLFIYLTHFPFFMPHRLTLQQGLPMLSILFIFEQLRCLIFIILAFLIYVFQLLVSLLLFYIVLPSFIYLIQLSFILFPYVQKFSLISIYLYYHLLDLNVQIILQLNYCHLDQQGFVLKVNNSIHFSLHSI